MKWNALPIIKFIICFVVGLVSDSQQMNSRHRNSNTETRKLKSLSQLMVSVFSCMNIYTQKIKWVIELFISSDRELIFVQIIQTKLIFVY